MSNSKPTNILNSPRFAGIKTFMRLPHTQYVDDVDFAVIGVPCDVGNSYKNGQRHGPDAIRNASPILRAHNTAMDISPFDYCTGIDYGDLSVVPGYIEDSFEKIENELYSIVQSGAFPILLGGDHAITLPHLRAISRKHGPVALIHFDSHSDTTKEYYGRQFNHGTIIRRAIEENLIIAEKTIQIGLRGSTHSKHALSDARNLGLEIISTSEAQHVGMNEVIKRFQKRVGDAKTFITIDIDFVDPAFAPGTGTQEVAGFTSSEAMQLIRGIEGVQIVGCDIVEVLPALDPAGITALLAANFAYEFISLLALQKRDKQEEKI